MKPLLIIAVLMLSLAPLADAHAQADRPDIIDTRWGQIQGLMAGIAVMHAVQPIAAAFGDLEWKDKYYVSIAGSVLYTTAFIGHMYEQEWSLWIALIGPAVGLTTVLIGWILSETGVINATIRPDVFQISGGVLQVLAWLIAFQLLREDPQFQERTGASSLRSNPKMIGLQFQF